MQVLQAAPNFRVQIIVVLNLAEFAGQQCEALADIIVKFSTDAGAFLFLRFDQLSGHARECLFHLFATGNILCKDENPSNSAFSGLPRTNFPACPMRAVLPLPTVFVS